MSTYYPLGDITSDILGWGSKIASVFSPAPAAANPQNEEDAKTSAFNLLERLRRNNQTIKGLENLVRTSPSVARAIGRDVIGIRQQHSDAVTKFTQAYTTLFGSTPQGLEAIPVVALGVVIGLLALVWEAVRVYEARLAQAGPLAQAALAAEQNRGALLTQAKAADQASKDALARGDLTTARQQADLSAKLMQQAGTPGVTPANGKPPGPPGDSLEWLKQNWVYLALAAGGLLIVPRMLDR